MHAQLLVQFHFEIVFVGGGGVAFRRGRGGVALCGQLVACSYHFDEFAAAQLEVDVFVVAEDGGVVGCGVLECFVDVAFEDGGADF
jgi:siroheme synthase (precorrin-2 oxidase/ferrochelatase)